MSKIQHNQKTIYIAAILLTLACSYFLVTSNNDGSDIKSLSRQKIVLDDGLTSTVKLNKTIKKQSTVKKSHLQETVLFMVDENDYRPFELDDLLDINDRTIESERAIFNYNNLLEMTHALNALKNKTLDIEDIGINDIQTWVKMLIYDLYYRNAKYNNLVNNFDTTKLNEIDVNILPAEEGLSERMDIGYLKQLKSLAEDINISRNRERHINQLSKFSNKRIQSAQLFIEVKIKKYFESNDFTLNQKIAFANTVIQTKDIYLIKLVISYFNYQRKTKEHLLTPEILELINNFGG